MKSVIAILAACAGLGGCDTMYGIRREAPLSSMPSLPCIEGVLRSTVGIATVETSKDEGGTALTSSGLKSPASSAYSFRYKGVAGSNIIGVLQVTFDHNGRTDIIQSLLDINRKPPQADIDATRPVMARIEESIESQCEVPGLRASIQETCKGVQCPATLK